MAAARSDVAAIRDRISAGESLLRRFLDAPDSLTPAEREQGVRLEAMARTGRVQVDYRGLSAGEYPAACYAQARQLFVIDPDLAPLLIYAAGLSGRNPETLKELPAEHRLLEERAVSVTLTKRRRGKANSRATVHWSVDPDRDLRTMGGFYLLLHRMTARSRAFSHTAAVWSIWAGSGRGGARHAATAPCGSSTVRTWTTITARSRRFGCPAVPPDATGEQCGCSGPTGTSCLTTSGRTRCDGPCGKHGDAFTAAPAERISPTASPSRS
jgi:hypothetical protein